MTLCTHHTQAYTHTNQGLMQRDDDATEFTDDFQWAPVLESSDDEVDSKRLAGIREREKSEARPWQNTLKP